MCACRILYSFVVSLFYLYVWVFCLSRIFSRLWFSVCMFVLACCYFDKAWEVARNDHLERWLVMSPHHVFPAFIHPSLIAPFSLYGSGKQSNRWHKFETRQPDVVKSQSIPIIFGGRGGIFFQKWNGWFPNCIGTGKRLFSGIYPISKHTLPPASKNKEDTVTENTLISHDLSFCRKWLPTINCQIIPTKE